MTNKERFQETFKYLHASPEIITEVLNMSEEKRVISVNRKRNMGRVAAAVAVLVIAVGSGSVAYAMDLGGIQRMVQVWIHGDQTDAIFTVNEGKYTLEYENEEGNLVQQNGGGIAFEADGTQRPLTEEELWEDVITPDVEYKEDGTVWVYYKNQELNITDKFENEICYLQLEDGDEVKFLTIKYQNGYAMSPHGYVQP
ncbi:MAG: hypothetical protein IKW30_04735 [Lachnospiraceae bacterium]|nr:hypothetical protein [Lachnospiraceae bacterium]